MALPLRERSPRAADEWLTGIRDTICTLGRLHREHGAKRDVLVIDYHDQNVPVLARMAAKRRSGYRALGYVIE